MSCWERLETLSMQAFRELYTVVVESRRGVLLHKHRRAAGLILLLLVALCFYCPFHYDYFSEPVVARNNRNQRNKYGDNGVQRLPDVIIVGVMKAGTRAAINLLQRHPVIEIAKGEGKFFNQESAYRKGLAFYRSIMPFVKKTPYRVLIEKCPDYFEAPAAPERIRAMNTSAKIVVVLRDPIRRAQSDYARTQLAARTKRHINIDWITFESLATPWIFGHSVWTGFPPVRRSVYVTALRHWYETFPANQIHIVDGERLPKNPLPELKRLEQFLGVRSYFTREQFLKKRDDNFPCFTNLRRNRTYCMQIGKGHSHKVISQRSLRTLRDYFQPYNRELFQLTNLTFEWSYS